MLFPPVEFNLSNKKIMPTGQTTDQVCLLLTTELEISPVFTRSSDSQLPKLVPSKLLTPDRIPLKRCSENKFLWRWGKQNEWRRKNLSMWLTPKTDGDKAGALFPSLSLQFALKNQEFTIRCVVLGPWGGGSRLDGIDWVERPLTGGAIKGNSTPCTSVFLILKRQEV